MPDCIEGVLEPGFETARIGTSEYIRIVLTSCAVVPARNNARKPRERLSWRCRRTNGHGQIIVDEPIAVRIGDFHRHLEVRAETVRRKSDRRVAANVCRMSKL